MEKEIYALLKGRMEGDRLHQLVVSAVYNVIDNNCATHPVIKLMLNEYETLREYIEAKNDMDTLSPSEKDLLLELKDDVEYYIDTEFSDAEDDCISELMSARWRDKIREEMTRRGAIKEGEELGETNIEACFESAFLDFDKLHQQTYELAMGLNPKTLYEEAEAENKAYRERHHILFDESDFMDAYTDAFSKEELYRLWKDRLEQAFKYGKHYDLISEADALWDTEEKELLADDTPIHQEDSEEPDSDMEEDEDRVPEEYLIPKGDLKRSDYTYVCELMQEYTGRRVMPSDEEEGFKGQAAYWTTYGDDFQELLSYYVLDTFEKLVDKISYDKPRQWDSFGRYLGLDPKDRMDAVQILDHSDRINYFLTNLIEKMWIDFTETKIEDVLCDTTTTKA